MATGMGIGKLGAPNIILKRKFRYTFEIYTRSGHHIPKNYVKLAARPQLDLDEVELNYLNGVTWVPGKGRWQPITVTYVDVAGNGEHSEFYDLYNWIATVYNFTGKSGDLEGSNPLENLDQSEKDGWAGVAALEMLDGCGNTLERWLMGSCWPQSVNFGDLDYSNSEEATIEMTLRYSEVTYTNMCGPQVKGTCSGCTS